jgi:molybdopterin converting factor small subunit
VKFRFSGTLLRFVDYRKEVAIDGAPNVGLALQNLVATYPALTGVLYDAESNVRRTHRMFLNGESLDPEHTDQALGDGDTIEILTAIAGG